MSRRHDYVNIEIFLKNENNKSYLGYEVDDNDENLLFTPFLFPECLAQFYNDENIVREITPEIIKRRLEEMKKKVIMIPDDMIYKIECLINFIHKHCDSYIGIRTIFLI